MVGVKDYSIEISVFEGDTLVVKKTFDQDKIVIGRILSADFRIPNPRVSRIHALLERQSDGKIKITDLASTHGTFVNDERVVEKIVQEEDSLRLADLKIQCRKIVISQDDVITQEKNLQSAEEQSVQAEVVAAPDVKVSRDPTIIRSLKESARTRGVLDPTTRPSEELEVTVYWEETILAIDHYKKQRRKISVGESTQSDYLIPETAFPENFDLVEVRDDRAVVKLHPSMKLSARLAGNMVTLDELSKSGRSQIEISGSDIAKIQIGTIHFFLMFVPNPPSLPRAPLFDQGRMYWSLFASIFLLSTLLFAYGYLFRQPIEGVVKEFPEKYRKIVLKNLKFREVVKKEIEKKVEEKKGPEQKKSTEIKRAEAKSQAQKGGNEKEGAREKGTEGKRGTKTAKSKKGITNRPKTKTNVSKVNKAKRKEKKTLLDSLKNSRLGSRLKSAGGSSGSDNLKKAFEGVGGTTKSSGQGVGGSGLQGTGQRGGGKATGVAGLGTKGFGGGAQGSGKNSLPGKGKFLVSTEGSGFAVGGGLSREDIARVVNRHWTEVETCYQIALQRNPRTSGKVLMRWTIIKGGRVGNIQASSNTTGSSYLSNCILSRMKTWRFPSPPGESATVDWPFVFKSGS